MSTRRVQERVFEQKLISLYRKLPLEVPGYKTAQTWTNLKSKEYFPAFPGCFKDQRAKLDAMLTNKSSGSNNFAVYTYTQSFAKVS